MHPYDLCIRPPRGSMRGDPRRNADAVKTPEGSITERGYVRREEFEDLERVEHVLSQQPHRTNDHR